MATDDEDVHIKVVKKVMKHLEHISFNNSPPELSREVHYIIRKITKSKDPYEKVKIQSNKMAKKLYPHLKKIVKKADDSLLMATKLSIVGNVIDFGTINRFDIEDMIGKAVEEEFDLFTAVEMEDVNGNIVEVKKPLGRFRLDQLEAQKASLQKQISDIDERIAAIKAAGQGGDQNA